MGFCVRAKHLNRLSIKYHRYYGFSLSVYTYMHVCEPGCMYNTFTVILSPLSINMAVVVSMSHTLCNITISHHIQNTITKTVSERAQSQKFDNVTLFVYGVDHVRAYNCDNLLKLFVLKLFVAILFGFVSVGAIFDLKCVRT